MRLSIRTKQRLVFMMVLTLITLAFQGVIALAQVSGPVVPRVGGLSAENIVTISAAVVGLTQMVKWAGLPDHFGPLAVLVLAAFGVGLWGWSQGDIARATTFAYFTGWIAVALNAAGIFGFTRATANAVSSVGSPPQSGAGSNPTV